MTSEIQQIETALQHYFDGLYEGDTEKLARVFNRHASLFIEEEGALTALPVPQWFERVTSRPKPSSQNLTRADRVLMVDLLGPVNAVVKVQCQIPPKAYTDYLLLIKADGRWQIVAKAYCQTPTLV